MRGLIIAVVGFAAGYITARGVKDSDNKTIGKINDTIDGWFDHHEGESASPETSNPSA